MTVLETFVQGKKNDPVLCEDGVFLGKDYIVLIDGVTTKGALLKNGQASGCAAKDCILRALPDMPADLSAEDFMSRLDAALRQDSERLCTAMEHANLLRACVLVYSQSRREIWMYGDCQYRVNGETFSEEKESDQLLSHLRRFLLEDAIADGESVESLLLHDTAREKILPFLHIQQRFENRQGAFGFGVLNGCGVNPAFLRRKTLPKESCRVVFASDGYPVLFDTLQESEAYLEQVLSQDPLCFRQFPSTKGVVAGQCSFDDRSFVSFIV